jgi:membrane protease YdiL (CAAX protease family)
MIALILGGILYAFYLTIDIGLLVAITAGFVYWAYRKNHFYLANSVRYPPEIILLILMSVLLALLPVYIYDPSLKKSLSFQSVITAVFQAQLALIVFEELIFRGALWAFLRDLGLKEHIVFFLQAFLFWISHHNYGLRDNPYLFWIAIPLAAILLGFIVWRSKSLTPSTIAHFLFNFTSLLIKEIF